MSHFQQHPVIFPRQCQLQRILEVVQRLGRADHGAELLPVGGGRQELGSGVSISVTCHASSVTPHLHRRHEVPVLVVVDTYQRDAAAHQRVARQVQGSVRGHAANLQIECRYV